MIPEATESEPTPATSYMEQVGQNCFIRQFESLLIYAEQQVCLHEETHRGGVIWEICDSCGAKWADDEGGKPADAHDFPKPLRDARDFLDSLPNDQGERRPENDAKSYLTRGTKIEINASPLNIMNTETPEADNLFGPLWAKDDPPTDEELHVVTKRFRKMERERDEARRVAEELQQMGADGQGLPPLPWKND